MSAITFVYNRYYLIYLSNVERCSVEAEGDCGERVQSAVLYAAAARWYIVLCVGLRRSPPRRAEIADLCQHGLHSIPLFCSPLHLSASPCSIQHVSFCVIDWPLLHIHLLLLPLPHYCANKLHITQQPDLPYSGFCSWKAYLSRNIWKKVTLRQLLSKTEIFENKVTIRYLLSKNESPSVLCCPSITYKPLNLLSELGRETEWHSSNSIKFLLVWQNIPRQTPHLQVSYIHTSIVVLLT